MASSSPSGLTSAEATERLHHYGFNELSHVNRRSLLGTLAAEAREPMVLLLLACGAVYFSFGDLREALVLMGSVAIVIGITVIQERKTERALEALRHLSSPRASVIRDSQAIRIASRDVVPGDLLLLEEGDRIPADGILLSGSDLRVDESLLTGESAPVSKKPEEGVYGSTLVVRGRGHALVQATGAATEVGKIGRALDIVTSGYSPLHREIRELVKLLAIVALVFCLLTVLWLGLVRGEWREGLLAGLTLAMALLPEEFPVVLTIFFALGAYRIARQRVLTRRLPAIEALGSATVLCADKTGTLTENKMRVTHFWTGAGSILKTDSQPWDAPSRELAKTAALACPPESFDPVDRASAAFGAESFGGREFPKRVPVREFPLSPESPMIAEVYEEGKGFLVALKGAPEAVGRRCRLPPEGWSPIAALLEPLGAHGLRIIAVAEGVLPPGKPPTSLDEISFRFLGLLGMADPLRAGVREAVEECRLAGIQVVMITGDHPKTAAVIGKQAGLCETDIFARFKPLDKLRLVQTFRQAGGIVAMTGDGVNDAPALKAAHIGIAMGGRGTDVAREAADLVVLDDNFVSIVGAIRLGRRIYTNLQKSLSYLLSVHVPIAGMALVPLVMGWPLFFTPIHIVFLELVIDPTCSLVFEGEPEDPNVMRQPPRPHESRLLNRRTVIKSLLDGLAVLAATAVVFGLGLQREARDQDARALAFATLVIGNLILILANRTHTHNFWKAMFMPNRAWLTVTLVALGSLALTLYIPSLRVLFKFSYLHGNDVALAAAAQGCLVAALYVIQLLCPRPIGSTSPIGPRTKAEH